MKIKSPQDLKEAIEKAVNGDAHIISDIGDYITYNYYMNTHIKAGSPEDLENELLYTGFEIDHPELYAKVEEWVDHKFKLMDSED